MKNRRNVRYRVARDREAAKEFVDAIFDGKLCGDPTAGPGEPRCIEILFVAADLNFMDLGMTSTGKSRLIASTPQRGEHLWEPDESGHYMGSRSERLHFQVTEPGADDL